MKKILSIILCFMLINIVAIASETTEMENYGYIPYQREEWIVDEDVATFSAISLMGNATLPVSYDSRDYNFVSPVKNQGSDGTCWAFAALGAVESYLLKFEAPKDDEGNAVNNALFNFSENHMRYMMSSQFNNPHGYSVGISDGGNSLMSSSYFLGDYGPVNEIDDPYQTDDNYMSRDYSATKDIPLSSYRVDSVEFIPQYRYIGVNAAKQTLIDKTKKLIMDYGSVICGVNYATTYLNADKTALYCNKNVGVNHQVLIVGWDDTYSKTNFKTAPSKDGAFIIKNSHGPTANEDGYFYLSYCDVNLFFDVMAVTRVSQRNKYEFISNLDKYGSITTTYYPNLQANPVSYGNVFEKKTQNQTLVGVSLYTYENVTYDIYLINDELVDKTISEGNFVGFENYSPILLYKGLKTNNNGYTTVRFKNVELTNDKYAIMVTADSDDIIYMPREQNANVSSNGQIVPFIDGVTMKEKESFFICNDFYPGVFNDAYNKNLGNFAIKSILRTADSYVDFEFANITDSNGKAVTDFENEDDVYVVPAMNYKNLSDKQIICVGYKGDKMMIANYKNVGKTNRFLVRDIPKDFGEYTFYMYVWDISGLTPVGNGIKVGTN